MAIIGKIRKNTRLLVSVVTLGLFFFMAQEFMGTRSPWANKNPIIGSAAGKNITLKSFQSQVEEFQRNYLMNYEQAPSEEEVAYLRKMAWEKLVNDIIYGKICQTLGIQVSEEELVDMVQGDHIHPDLKAAFLDPATKEFSKKDLLAALQNISKLPPAKQTHWYQYEQALAQKRCQDKFQQLIERSVFATSLEAKQKWTIENTSLDIQYLYIPYRQVEQEVTITKTMLKAYLKQHSNDYQVEESKEIRYIVFPIAPSEKDHVDFHQGLEELKQKFAQTAEDKLFASIHTDSNPNLVSLQCTKKDLPAALSSHQGVLKEGVVVGPVAEGETYKLYKVTSLLLKKPQSYELNVIEKRLAPSDETKEETFKKAEDFIKQVKTKAQFDAQAEQRTIDVSEAKVGKGDTRIGKLHQVRELVIWLYNQGKVGKVSPIFETADGYVIAAVIAHTKAGIAPLQEIEAAVKDKVLNEKKAEVVTAKLEPLSNLPLAEAALQYGSEANVSTAQQVKFDTTYLESIETVKKTVPQAFALEAGKRSRIIADCNGVVLLEVTQRQIPTLPDSWQAQQMQQVNLEKRTQFFQLPTALDDLARTKDYRYKYY